MNIGLFGRAGVLIFFVHTSLVLMMSMERMRETGWRLLPQFYIRRLFRIYPLSILLCVVVSLCAIPRGLFGAPFVWSPRLFLDNVLLVQNITHSGLLSSPLWSLPYEIQMYLVMPILFLLMANRHWQISFAILFGAACFAGRYLELAQFAPCFLVGILVFKALPLIRRPALVWWLWPGAVVALLLCYDVFHPSSNSLNKEWALCAAIAVLIPLFQDCHSRMAATIAKLIARYSYGIYLCHLPLMWIFYRKLVGTAPLMIRHLGFAVSVAILPVLCYHLLEYPFIRAGVRLSQRFSDRAADAKFNSCAASGR
jgi:peptidoglycan/LPS O-acetylase OafA/YrhL